MLSRRSMVTGAGTGVAAATAALVMTGVPTTAAQATTPLPNWINVSAYASVNAAFAAVSSTQNVLYFPAGSYTITSTINISFQDVTFIGDGAGSSIITSSVSASDTIYANNVTNLSIYGLQIQAPTGASSGAVIHTGATSNVYLSDVTISGGFVGVQMDASPSGTTGSDFRYILRDFFILSTVSSAILVGSNATTGMHPPADVFLGSGMISACGAGITINCTGGLYADNVDIAGCSGAGITILPASNQWVTTARFNQVLCDTCSYGWIIGGSGAANGIELSSCWASMNTHAGIDINGSGVNGVVITGGYFGSNGQDGIRLDAGTNLTINGAQVFDNNTTNSGYSGITIQSGSGFQITNCLSGVGGVGGSTNHQSYGIAIFSSTSNNFIVTSNRLPGNVSGGLVNYATGANQVVTNNINF